MMQHLLSIIVWTPALGALLLAFLPSSRGRLARAVALAVTLATLGLALVMWSRFTPSYGGFQMAEAGSWFSLAGMEVTYSMGVDGVSIFLVLLTALLFPVSLGASPVVDVHVKPYLMCILVLETGILGVFLSLDMVLFYLFWEITLVPMVFLIGIWGSKNRVYAAVKFFVFTMAGSLLMLVGIIALAVLHGRTTGDYTFSLVKILESCNGGGGLGFVVPIDKQVLYFLAFTIAFAVKVPLFPLHTWLPDAHTEAPTAGSVILAGVLLKMGTYGLLRFCLPLFPDASLKLAPAMAVLAVVGIVYGALVAMVQPDLKRLVAYSSVSHMGYVVLGIFSFNCIGGQGASLQMLNHGLSTGALFLLVGMVYDRRHTRQISDFGGLAKPMPACAVFFMVAMLSSIGLPALNGFVGEILILQGAFLWNRTFAVLAASGMVLSAVYMLWMYQRVFLGETARQENRVLPDLRLREKATLVPLVALMVWIGVHPSTFLRPMDASVQKALKPARASMERAVDSPVSLYYKAR